MPSDHTNLSDEFEADDTVRDIVEQMRPQLEEKLNLKFTFFKAIRFRKQTVRGTNFYVKLKVAGVNREEAAETSASSLAASNNQPMKFIHVRIWRDLPVNQFKLTLYDKIVENKLESDPIDYFE